MMIEMVGSVLWRLAVRVRLMVGIFRDRRGLEREIFSDGFGVNILNLGLRRAKSKASEIDKVSMY